MVNVSIRFLCKICLSVGFLLISLTSFAQGLYNNGANIVATDASYIYIDGSTANKGNYYSTTTGIIKNSGTLGTCNITLTGNWTNDATNTGFSNTGSTVNFNNALSASTLAQGISGTGSQTAFYNVNFNGTGIKTFSGTGSSISNFAKVNAGTVVANAKLTLTSTATTNANLVGPSSGLGNYITGDVKVESYYTGGSLLYRRYRFASSPINDLASSTKTYAQIKAQMLVTSPLVADFDAGSTTATIQTYNETLPPSTYSYSSIPTITTTHTAGTGFALFYRGDRINDIAGKLNATAIPEGGAIVYQGVVNQGPVTVGGLTYNAFPLVAGILPSDGWNLLGNPYPCTINFLAIDSAADRKNIDKTVYCIRPNSSGFQGIVKGATYNGGTGIIQPGQGFFIQATVNNSSITFRESIKITDNTSPMRLLSSPKSIILAGNREAVRSMANSLNPSVQPKVLRINIQDELNIDETLITFSPAYSTAYKLSEDAGYMGGSTVSLNSISENGVALLYNGLPVIKKGSEVKLSINSPASKSVKLNFTDLSAVGYYQMFLKDNYLNTLTDVNSNPSYSFEINKSIPTSFGTDRFVIIFKAPIPVQLVEFTATVNKGAELKWKTEHEEFNDYFELERSLDGKSFMKLDRIEGANSSSGNSNYIYTDNDPFNGVNYYRLKQVDKEGIITYADTVNLSYSLNNLTNSESGTIVVYPNPAQELINVDIPNRELKQITINIYDMQGKKIRSKQLGANDKLQENVSGLYLGIYFIEVINTTTNELIGRRKFVKV